MIFENWSDFDRLFWAIRMKACFSLVCQGLQAYRRLGLVRRDAEGCALALLVPSWRRLLCEGQDLMQES